MDTDLPPNKMSWSAEMFFSNAKYQAKKMIFLLFINRAYSVIPIKSVKLIVHYVRCLVESQ